MFSTRTQESPLRNRSSPLTGFSRYSSLVTRYCSSSEDFEDAIRNAISLGGDSDTLACITGGIAGAFYGGVPEFITQKVMAILDDDLREITIRFMEVYRKDEVRL
jgi:ADP-ribosylglycohydrolase